MMLFISHLTEFGTFVLEEVQVWFSRLVPVVAFISVMVCQIFYNKLEQHGKRSYLVITIVSWLCCGSSRILLFVTTANMNLDLRHIRHTMAFTTAMLCFLLAMNDLISIIKEVRNFNGKELKKVINYLQLA